MELTARRCARQAIFAGLVLLGCVYASPGAAQADGKKSKPTITLKSTPVMAFSPARMVLTAEIRGGDNDYQDFYCATVEWDWGDDTRSQAGADCEPYEAGQERNHTAVHHRPHLQYGGRLPGRISPETEEQSGREGGDGSEDQTRHPRQHGYPVVFARR